MSTAKVKTGRNQSIEICKMLAAVMVVFIHADFPGEAGRYITCLARFAVPMFFAISGYFGFRATSQQLRRRLFHILKLNLVAIALEILWDCFTASPVDWTSVASVAQHLSRWVILQVNPFSGHLWYLTALALCYLVLWGYVTFFGENTVNYRSLYFAGFCLFVVYFAMAVVLPVDGAELPYQSYRNGWFVGIPMFLMGIFLHEYQEQILKNYQITTKKQVFLILIGIVLSLLQCLGRCMTEIPFGTFIEVPALLLFLVCHPKLPVQGKFIQGIVAKCGTVSTAVYILHLIVLDAYERFFAPMLPGILMEKEDWLRPLIVLGLSLLATIVWERIDTLLKHLKKAK